MKRFYLFLLLLFLFVAGGSTGRGVYAQNLVPNPSFEQYNYCPNNYSTIQMPPTPSSVVDWNKPTTATSDYFNTCSTRPTGIPDNGFGSQFPRTGNAYAGAYIINDAYREYLQSPLSTPLIAGHEYLVSFWVNLADKSGSAADQMGAYFNPGYIARTTNYGDPLDDLTPQITNTPGRWLSDTARWMEVWGVFKASGGESAVILGSFVANKDQNTRRINSGSGYTYGYYYFDDVCVLDITLNSSFSTTEKKLCEGTPTALSGQAGKSHYIWNTGDTTQSIAITDTGTYWVQSFGSCEAWMDTFIVSYTDMPDFSLGNDTVLCEGGTLDLHAPGQSDITYQWNDNSTDRIYKVTQSGKYWITIHKEGCSVSDTIQVIINDFKQDLGADTVLCKGTPFEILLQANVPDGAQVKWSTGSREPSIRVATPDTYWVSVSDPLCTNSDTIKIMEHACECTFNMPNAFSPNNDGLNDVFRPQIEAGCEVHHYALNIYNRYGQRVYSANRPEQGWDGRQNGQPAETGTYFYEIKFIGGTKGISYYQRGDLTLIR